MLTTLTALMLHVSFALAFVSSNTLLTENDLELVKNENLRIDRLMNKSPNFKTVVTQSFGLANAAQPTQSKIVPLNETQFLNVVHSPWRGFEKIDFISDGQSRKFFDREHLGSFGSYFLLQSVEFSPQRTKIALKFSVDGGTTRQVVLFYDVATHSFSRNYLSTFPRSLNTFVSEDEFAFALDKIAYILGTIAVLNFKTNAVKAAQLSDYEPLPHTIVTTTFERKPLLLPDMPSPELTLTGSSLACPSQDGALVPAVAVYNKSDEPFTDRPVIINSYGGFGKNNLENISQNHLIDPMKRIFFEKGGVIVYPGLRGGSELGKDWHASGAGAINKRKTFEDLAACADHLVNLRITTPEKIVSTGVSNGGLTVAATALLYPDKFGLVIPQVAVLDLVNFLDVENADAPGWIYDYGNPKNAFELEQIKMLSPVNLAQNHKNTKFLILGGIHDDRVNPIHSIRLFRALKEKGQSPENVHMYIVNAGHNLVIPQYNGGAEWLATNRYWTFIFDHFGFDLGNNTSGR